MILLRKAFWACLILPLVFQCGQALRKEDEKYVKRAFFRALNVLVPKARNFFRQNCGDEDDPLCPRKWLFSTKIQQRLFRPGEKRIEKDRFYQSYLCYKFRQIKVCPLDGAWGAWTAWSRCSGKCGLEGGQNRTRLCNNPLPVRFGRPCVGPSDKRRQCIRHCKKKVSSRKEAQTYLDFVNSGFPKLERECRSGHCTYDDLSHYLGGKEKEKYWASMQCIHNDRECPVDGGWSAWTEWTTCQPVCGLGYRHRERSCSSPTPKNGGYQCIGSTYQNHHCFGTDCTKADLIFGHYLSDWSDFSPCSVSCGKYGIQRKRRLCLKPNHCARQLENGSNEIHITKPCYKGECPAKGGWSSWQKLDFCSARCGIGRKTRIRLCNFPFPKGSAYCIGNEVETNICRGPCDESWDKVVKDIKTGLQSKMEQNSEDIPAKGDTFSVPLIKNQEANYTKWSKWSQCAKSCEGGFRWRERKCKTAGQCSGEIFQRQLCNTAKCPVKGGWSDWVAWSVCSVTCGQGVMTRYRKCDNPYPQGGGTCAESSAEKRKCNKKPCSKNYLRFGEWGSWSTCSQPCGQSGTRARRRGCVILPKGESQSKNVSKNSFLSAELSPPINISDKQPKKQKSSRGQHKITFKHSHMKHEKHTGDLSYEDFLRTKYEVEKLAKQQSTTRKIVKQIYPEHMKRKLNSLHIERLSHRNVKTGHYHQNTRHRRKAHLPMPSKLNLPIEAKVLKKCSAHATKMVSRCNVRTCPVDGKWSNWGSWTKCSQTCGQGTHIRERTCTDPFPNGSGKTCDGSGTEAAHCFQKPCADLENKGIYFHGKSFLAYRMRNKPTPYLLLSVLFKPEGDSGVIVHRYRQCGAKRCAHELALSLDKGQPWLRVSDGKFKADLKYPNKIKKNMWHSAMVCIFKNRAFMRIDDGKHTIAIVKFDGELNFDAQMTVGWNKDRTKKEGFIGLVASLRVNFRALSLFKDSKKTQYGSPFKRISVKERQLEPTVPYPIFHGNNYMKLSVMGTERFSVELVFSPLTVNGVLLFNHGNEENSLVYIKLTKAVLKLCFNCGKKLVCTDLSDIQPESWYHMSLVIRKRTAKIRLNAGPSIELNSFGLPFSPSRILYIGGGEKHDRNQLDKDAKTHTGFMGYIYHLRINGQYVNMKGAAIMNTYGFLNSMGMTYSASDAIKEGEKSDVMLKCDYTYYARKTEDVEILWFEVDKLINRKKSIKIHEKLRGQPYTSGLELFGKGHEGIYLCAVHHAGVVVVQHAFIVEEPIPTKEWNTGKEEELTVRIVAVVLPVVFIVCLFFVCRYRAEVIGRTKTLKLMRKFYKLSKCKESAQLHDTNGETKNADEASGIVDKEENVDVPHDEDTSNLNTPYDTSNMTTPRDGDTSNMTTPRDGDTSNISNMTLTPHDRDSRYYGTPGDDVEENDIYDQVYEEPIYQNQRKAFPEKQVYFQGLDDTYDRQGHMEVKEEEIPEDIDNALDAIMHGIASKRSIHNQMRGSTKKPSREEMLKSRHTVEDEDDDILRSDGISKTTYSDTLRSRQMGNLQDKSVHAVFTSNPCEGVIYETKGTSVNGLQSHLMREEAGDEFDDVYQIGTKESVLYDISVGQPVNTRSGQRSSPDRLMGRHLGTSARYVTPDFLNRLKHDIPDSNSGAEKVVLPNVASNYRSKESILMTDDLDHMYINNHHRTYPKEPCLCTEDKIDNTNMQLDESLIFKTRTCDGMSNTRTTQKYGDEKTRLSFIAPHSYSDHHRYKVVDDVSNKEQDFTVPKAPSPPVIPPSPPPPMDFPSPPPTPPGAQTK